MNVIAPILQFGRMRQNEPAVVDGTRIISYGELGGLVRRTARHLVATGLQHGDRIGMCLKDTADHLITLLSAALMGGVAVPLDWRARPAENDRFVRELGLTCVIAEADSKLLDGGSVIRSDAEWHRAVSEVSPDFEGAGEWHDPFLISATSGSTGVSKFTLMTHLQYHFAIAGMFELMALRGRQRFLCTMPLFYSGGRNSCLAHLLRGDCVVLYPSVFTVPEYIDVVRRQEITVAGVVPTVLRRLLASPVDGPLFAELTMLFSTGAPLHAEEKREAARKLTKNFYERYGTAETLAISILRPEDLAERADSVGRPHSTATIEIADENDMRLPSGAVGRLRFRGKGLASPLPGQASEANFRNGWYYPGEIAYLDEQGYILLQGRMSDVIIRSGTKIYPAEIERTLLEHPKVADAAVLGNRTVDNEESVIAFVAPREGLSAGELLAHCRIRLTPHKVPKQIYFLGQLPKNTAGKIDKIALAALLADTTSSEQVSRQPM